MSDAPEVVYPDAGSKWVKRFRFINILDDAHNTLSPVKINLWAANITAISAGMATVISWIAGHLGPVAEVWGAVGGWLTQAHVTHHFDKRERNRAAAALRNS